MKEMSLYAAQKNKKCFSNSNNKECHAIEDLSTFNYKDMTDINNKISI